MSEHSPAQKQYLLRVKREKNLIRVSRILLFLGFLILWEVSARFGWIDSFIFSSPSEIWITFLKMLKDQSLFTHIGITLAETLVSFVFTVLLGIGTAVLLWTCPRLSHVLEPYLVVLNSLPKSALAPLLIVWLGANIRTIIVAGISVAIFGSIINLYTGFRVLPSSVPLILSIMKVNIGLCLVGVIIGEFIGARQGLGYLIIYGSQTFNCAGIRIRTDIVTLIFLPIFRLFQNFPAALATGTIKTNSPFFF